MAVCLRHQRHPGDFEVGVFLAIEQFRFADDLNETSFSLIGDVLLHQFDAVVEECADVWVHLLGSGKNFFAPGEAAVHLAAFGGKLE